MAWLWVVLVVVVLGLTAAVAVGRGGALERAYPDRRDVRLPASRPVSADDLEDVEFSVVFRGYRMDEVDAVVERLAQELAARDARLADLEPRVRSSPGYPGESPPASARRGAGQSARGPAAGRQFVPTDRRPGAPDPYADDERFAGDSHADDDRYTGGDRYADDELYVGDERYAGESHAVGRSTDQRYADGPYTGDHHADDNHADDNHADERYSDERYSDERFADDRYADGRHDAERYAAEPYADELLPPPTDDRSGRPAPRSYTSTPRDQRQRPATPSDRRTSGPDASAP